MPRTDPATTQPYATSATIRLARRSRDRRNSSAPRMWGVVSLARIDLLPFLYKLHYTLHLPIVGGFDLGTWLIGIAGICGFSIAAIALVLSFPSVKAWRKSFAFRMKRGGYALTLVPHRWGGVWIWGLLLDDGAHVDIDESHRAGHAVRSSPTFRSSRRRCSTNPELVRVGPARQARCRSRANRCSEMARRDGEARNGIAEALVRCSTTAPMFMATAVGFLRARTRSRRRGPRQRLALLQRSARASSRARTIPGRGSAGDIFMQAQFPLHSGRIVGLPGRILMSAVGIAVAMLSATGLMIWFRKRAARRRAAAAPVRAARRGSITS